MFIPPAKYYFEFIELCSLTAPFVRLQEEVFSTVGKKIIEGCVYGYNGTIFA